ncbi:MAG TPA: Rieske (2Fe-2S) protein [Sphingomonas sp.]|jgi:nitrite reductase/ring-hydroxylating ferredoxin subunit|uniref:Rieske (2Fe-2S) protein n=1 Tax=Sphingomonas sp. TaxID=28214 RepID=UPI002EDB0B28
MTDMGERRYHRAARADGLVDGTGVGLIVQGWPVLLALVDGQIRATIDRCPHAASDLGSGRIRRGAILCPLHGARFDLATGKCIGGSYAPLLLFDTRVVGGWVEVAVPDAAPGFEHLPVRARN